MKRLLYIGHSYHQKTKSADFILQMLSKDYEVSKIYFDPYTDNMDEVFSVLNGKFFDILLLWQIMPHLDKLKKMINVRHSVFFPMYDGAPDRDDNIWAEYKDTQIISFCRKLHEDLKKIGFSSHYIQFFPEPITVQNMGKTDSVFFWQRINDINADLVAKLLENTQISHLHFHKAIDPAHTMTLPQAKYKITTSEWFDTKEDMHKVMQNSALYIAPRLFEGIGMSFLEAMAMGRCVIAADNPTMNEYIKNGETGYLYNPQNPQPLELKNIPKIQKNTQKYIENGYAKWEKEKFKILDWIEEKTDADTNKIGRYYQKLYGKTEYKLFSVIPLLTVKKNHRKIKFYLFGCLPIFKIRKKENEKTA